MRAAWMIVLAACGGSQQASTMAPPPQPPPPPADTTPVPTTVATNDAPPPPTVTGGDPCMGGEVTPATGGGGLPAPGGPPAPPAPSDPATTGTGWGTIGTPCHGTGCGYGVGHGNPCGGGMRERGHGPVVHLPAGASVDGPLDKAIIRRYIKRNLNKIQYCYERELKDHPGLAGTVMVKFVINPNGIVVSSFGTGLAKVDACVAGVIKDIEFPKPKGDKVEVSYPFTFAASG